MKTGQKLGYVRVSSQSQRTDNKTRFQYTLASEEHSW